MQIGSFELFVEVDGHRIPEFGHNSNTFVEGRKGKPFVLKVRNNSAQRALVHPTIDHKSVLTGEPVDPNASETGYVVQPYSSIEIRGWRTSLESSQKFVFDAKGKSYAAKSGDGTKNCGVIGMAVHTEKVSFMWATPAPEIHHHHYHEPEPCIPGPRPIWYTTTMGATSGLPDMTCSSSSMLRSAIKPMSFSGETQVNLCQSNAGASPDFNLGTAFGEVQSDVVQKTTFDCGALVATFAMYYTDAAGLRKIGIDPKKASTVSLPQAFSGFCQPPKQ